MMYEEIYFKIYIELGDLKNNPNGESASKGGSSDLVKTLLG